jgi:hypothetical protein
MHLGNAKKGLTSLQDLFVWWALPDLNRAPYTSDTRHDLIAEAMDDAGLNNTYFSVGEDGEVFEEDDIAMRVPLKSRHLQKIEDAAKK